MYEQNRSSNKKWIERETLEMREKNERKLYYFLFVTGVAEEESGKGVGLLTLKEDKGEGYGSIKMVKIRRKLIISATFSRHRWLVFS